MFKEDKEAGLPVKLTRQKKKTSQVNKSIPTKRKAKATGKRTGGHPTQKLQTSCGMNLQTEEKVEKKHNNTREKTKSSGSDSDDNSSTCSRDIAPLPKSLNQNVRLPQRQQCHFENQCETASRRSRMHSGILSR